MDKFLLLLFLLLMLGVRCLSLDFNGCRNVLKIKVIDFLNRFGIVHRFQKDANGKYEISVDCCDHLEHGDDVDWTRCKLYGPSPEKCDQIMKMRISTVNRTLPWRTLSHGNLINSYKLTRFESIDQCLDELLTPEGHFQLLTIEIDVWEVEDPLWNAGSNNHYKQDWVTNMKINIDPSDYYKNRVVCASANTLMHFTDRMGFYPGNTLVLRYDRPFGCSDDFEAPFRVRIELELAKYSSAHLKKSSMGRCWQGDDNGVTDNESRLMNRRPKFSVGKNDALQRRNIKLYWSQVPEPGAPNVTCEWVGGDLVTPATPDSRQGPLFNCSFEDYPWKSIPCENLEKYRSLPPLWCVPEFWHCDEVRDCPLGDDEHGCAIDRYRVEINTRTENEWVETGLGRVITCRVIPDPTPTEAAGGGLMDYVHWEKNGEIIPSEQGRVKVRHRNQPGDLELVFDPVVDATDDGNYACVVTKGTKTVRKTLRIMTYDRPCIKAANKQRGFQGQNDKIYCEVTGRPTPEVEWIGPNGPINEGFEYYINPDVGSKMTYAKAKILCQLFDGTLPMPKTAIENQHLARITSAHSNGRFWLGLTPGSYDYAWNWIDDSAATWTNWVAPYGKITSDENCVWMLKGDGPARQGNKWNNTKCKDKVDLLVCRVRKYNERYTIEEDGLEIQGLSQVKDPGPYRCRATQKGSGIVEEVLIQYYVSMPEVFTDTRTVRCPGALRPALRPRRCKHLCDNSTMCFGDEDCLCDGECGASCIKPGVRCPALKNITNGYVKISSDALGGGAFYHCHDEKEFAVVGNAARTCQGNGKWSGQEPMCWKVLGCPHGFRRVGQACFGCPFSYLMGPTLCFSQVILPDTWTNANTACKEQFGGRLASIRSGDDRVFANAILALFGVLNYKIWVTSDSSSDAIDNCELYRANNTLHIKECLHPTAERYFFCQRDFMMIDELTAFEHRRGGLPAIREYVRNSGSDLTRETQCIHGQHVTLTCPEIEGTIDIKSVKFSHMNWASTCPMKVRPYKPYVWIRRYQGDGCMREPSEHRRANITFMESVVERCIGKNECRIKNDWRIFLPICLGSRKYLSVLYGCKKGENDLMKEVQCQEGQYAQPDCRHHEGHIHIRDVMYTVNPNVLQAQEECKDKQWKQSFCYSGWILRNGTSTCYKFSHHPRTWDDGQVYCKSEGGRLATPETLEDSKFLARHGGRYGPIWIGLENSMKGYKVSTNNEHQVVLVEQKGEWKWVTGGAPKSLLWAPGQPDNADPMVEGCAYITGGTSGLWEDANCVIPRHIVACQRPAEAYKVNSKINKEKNIEIVKKRCEGRKYCRIKTEPNVGLNDSSGDSNRYLKIDYRCGIKPGTNRTFVVCDRTGMNLTCSHKYEKLFIQNVLYGNAQTRELADIDCPGEALSSWDYECIPTKEDQEFHTLQIIEKCGGKHGNCFVDDWFNILADTCHGKYKYLRVDYYCL